MTDAAGERIVLCMKWGTKYGPEYVNRLYSMVRRHLNGDFRFICLTDRSAVLVMDGGELQIEWRASDDHVLMTGPVETEFEGLLP